MWRGGELQASSVTRTMDLDANCWYHGKALVTKSHTRPAGSERQGSTGEGSREGGGGEGEEREDGEEAQVAMDTCHGGFRGVIKVQPTSRIYHDA